MVDKNTTRSTKTQVYMYTHSSTNTNAHTHHPIPTPPLHPHPHTHSLGVRPSLVSIACTVVQFQSQQKQMPIITMTSPSHMLIYTECRSGTEPNHLGTRSHTRHWERVWRWKCQLCTHYNCIRRDVKVIGSSLQHHLSVTRCVGVLFDVVRSMYPLYTWPNNGHLEQVLHSAPFNHACCFTLGRSTVHTHTHTHTHTQTHTHTHACAHTHTHAHTHTLTQVSSGDTEAI